MRGATIVATQGAAVRTGVIAQYDPFGNPFDLTTGQIGTTSADSQVPADTTDQLWVGRIPSKALPECRWYRRDRNGCAAIRAKRTASRPDDPSRWKARCMPARVTFSATHLQAVRLTTERAIYASCCVLTSARSRQPNRNLTTCVKRRDPRARRVLTLFGYFRSRTGTQRCAVRRLIWGHIGKRVVSRCRHKFCRL
jgi:hypothetical protein